MTNAGTFRPANLVQGFDFSFDAGVGTLSLVRPDKRNALSRDMWAALPGLMRELDAAPGVRALIITGSGGHFSAGSDIADLNVPLADFWELNSRAEAAVANADIPTIAAIEGNCVGGGTEIAAACDVRIAGPESVFGVTAAKLGVVYPPGPTARLVDVVGASWARYLLMTGEIVGVEAMRERGFVHEVADHPYPRAMEVASLIGGRSALTQTAVKRMLRGEAVDASAGGWLAEVYESEIVEGQAAFAAKRAPQFGFCRATAPRGE